MKQLFVLSIFFLAAGASAADFTRLQAFEPTPDGVFRKLKELQVVELSPADLRSRTQKLVVAGQTYSVGDVRVSRISGVHDIVLELKANLYAEPPPGSTKVEPLPTVPGLGRRGKLTGVTLKPIPVGFDFRLVSGALPGDPCRALGCRPQSLVVKRWSVDASPAQKAVGLQYIHFEHAVQVKSIDYDWATGEWQRLVIAETLYEEASPFNVPRGGGSVGN